MATHGRTPDPEYVARVVAHAAIHGTPDAAKVFNMTERSVRNYKRAARDNPLIAEETARKKRAMNQRLDEDWKHAAVKALNAALAKGEELMRSATIENLRDVAGFIKIVGELDVVRRAGLDLELDAQPDPAPAEDAGNAGGGGNVVQFPVRSDAGARSDG